MRRGVASHSDAVAVGLRSATSKFWDSSLVRTPDRSAGFSMTEPAESVDELVERLKRDLRARFVAGENPAAAEYLRRFPELAANKDKVLSLVYEEYCLLEEMDQRPETREFCERYQAWTNSLQEQLDFHKIFSQVADSPSPQSTARYPQPPAHFSSFRLLSEIGQGGAARVYLASDEDLGRREVVLKLSADRGNEASIQGRLNHPNIVPVLSVARSEDSNLRGLCMPYRPGLSLDKVIARLFADGKKPDSAIAIWKVLAPDNQTHPARPQGKGWEGFPFDGGYPAGVAWIIERIALALHYAHMEGVYHRDVKPANILLTLVEGPQLLDFNLADAPHSPEEAAVALRGGTLPYMAPEHLRAFRAPEGWSEVTGGSDVYSLGLVAREVLSGKPPEVQDPRKPLPHVISEILEARTSAKPWPSLRESNPKIPHALEAILDLSLASDPKLRYADAEALAVDLGRFLERQPLRIARNPSRRERAANWGVRNHRILVLSAAVLTLATLVGGFRINKWLTPFEERVEFTTLVNRYKAKDIEGARPDLDSLKLRGFDSPLLWVYLGASYKNSEVPEDCRARLSAIWREPGSIDLFKAWSKKHPDFVDCLEQIALNLFSQNSADAPEEDRIDKETAALISEFVLSESPNRDKPRLLLAAFYEEVADYEKADRIASEPIAKGSGSSKPLDRHKILPFFETRARMTTKWLRSLIDGGVANSDEKRSIGLLERTFKDLQESIAILDLLLDQKMIDPIHFETFRAQNKYHLCDARLVQGDFLTSIGRPNDAAEAFSNALKAFEETSKGFETANQFHKQLKTKPTDTAFLHALEKRVRSRLRIPDEHSVQR